MPSIALFAAYFGALPAWIDEWIETCKCNPTITWFLFSDGANPRNQAANFHFIRLTPPVFIGLAEQRLGVRVSIPGGYKLCDFRPTFGALFAEQLQGLDFWGHCDLDVIWGDVRAFITDGLLAEYDVISMDPGRLCGPLTLFRNRDSINRLYRRAPYEQILSDPANQVFDEAGFDQIVKQARDAGELRLLLADLHEYDGYHAGIPPGESSCVWRDGKLFCTPEGRELMCYHFRSSKLWPWRTGWNIPGDEQVSGTESR